MSFETSLLGLAWLAILVLALAFSGLLRQHRLLLARLTERDQGRSSRRGMRLDLDQARGSERTLLIFAKPGCRSCSELANHLEGERSTLPAGLGIAFVFADRADGIDTRVPVLVGRKDWFESLNVRTTPLGVVVDTNGVVMADRPLGSLESLASLIQELGVSIGPRFGEVAS